MHRDDLIRGHLRVAKLIARRLAYTLRGDYEEFESAAYLGLVEAASRYDPAKNDNFERWADTRIRGAIYDYLRLQSRLPKDERAKRKEDPDRARTGPVFHTLRMDIDALDNVPGPATNPLMLLAQRDVHTLLEQLSPRHQRVLSMYHFERCTDDQIGALLGITGTRVCQIRGELYKRLRDALSARGLAFDDLW